MGPQRRRDGRDHPVDGRGLRSEAGVEISLEAPVAKVLVDGSRVAGVKLESGEEIAAGIVAANVGPALLYRQLVERSDMTPEFARRMDNFKAGSGTFRMNVALIGTARFQLFCRASIRPSITPPGSSSAPTLDYMDKAFTTAKAKGWSDEPIVEMKLPTSVDDSLAPEGQHIASLFCQQFAPTLPDGRGMGRRERQGAPTRSSTR